MNASAGIKVMVVEDEETLAETLSYALEREGYSVITAADGMSALQLFDREKPDAVLLDLMLPRLSGEEVCRRLRGRGEVPIIILSAKGSTTDKVTVLGLGADDYISKPFVLREVVARLQAVLRRAGIAADGEEPSGRLIRAGKLMLDTGRWHLRKGGSEIEAPLKELKLLEFLMRNRGQTMPRSKIIKAVWGEDYFGDTKTLDVHIRRLRKRIEDDPDKPKLIRTIRGIGYSFDA